MSENKPRAIDIGHDFMAYLYAHPEQRFWQALCNWAEVGKVEVQRYGRESYDDTYNWHGKGPTS